MVLIVSMLLTVAFGFAMMRATSRRSDPEPDPGADGAPAVTLSGDWTALDDRQLVRLLSRPRS